MLLWSSRALLLAFKRDAVAVALERRLSLRHLRDDDLSPRRLSSALRILAVAGAATLAGTAIRLQNNESHQFAFLGRRHCMVLDAHIQMPCL